MHKHISCIVLIVSVILIFGCGQQNLPKDLPKLHPTLIHMTQDGKPLADAVVTAVGAQGESKWSGAGKTDAQGLVKLFVNGQYEGMPKGTFKVLVTKIESDPAPETPPEPDPQTDREAWVQWNQKFNGPHMIPKSYNLVTPVYANRNKTPLEISVDEGKNEFTLDAGKTVRLPIR